MGFTMYGNYAVYTAGSKIYTEDAARMREKFKALQEKGHKFFVVDLSGTDYLDSAGLGVLVGIHKKALELGGGVKLVGVTGNVKEIFELTRLNKVFEMVSSLCDLG
jgi:anti-sigma B factor antagonist